MFDGKYILLIYTVALQVHCAYTVALQVHCAYTVAVQEYYVHWLWVFKQRGIPKKQSFYEDPHWK